VFIKEQARNVQTDYFAINVVRQERLLVVTGLKFTLGTTLVFFHFDRAT
jgi:hypothetical protein